MFSLKTIWKRISETGVSLDISEDEIRRIRLLNGLNAIVLAMMLLSVIPDLIRGNYESPSLLLFSILASVISVTVFLSVFFLVLKKKYFAAKTTWFSFMFLLGFTPTYLTMNTEARVETFFLIVIPLLALLLYKDSWVAITTLLFTLFAYYALVWFNPTPVIIFPENEKYFSLLFISVTVFLLTYQLNSVNRKYENKLMEQKSTIEQQKNELHIKNTEILDSITYAKHIQKAILPHINTILEALPLCFVLYKPKDIVAGDFFWFHSPSPLGRAGEGLVLIAAADCTGHGVPGALTSMICSEKLNDAVKYSCNPGDILSLTNKGIKVSLKQGENTESSKDGMDIALCSVDIKNGIVKYAGANRPLYIIRNGQTTVEEIKATKKAIGGFTEDNQVFETHIIQLQRGDTFYLSSDGYSDQDGGEKGKKLMTKTFKQMLIDIQGKSMKEQKEYLEMFIENWRADRHQLDDILVIGVRM